MSLNFMYSLSRQSITDMSIQNGVQFDEGQLDQWMSLTRGSQGRVAGSLLLFWQRLHVNFFGCMFCVLC